MWLKCIEDFYYSGKNGTWTTEGSPSRDLMLEKGTYYKVVNIDGIGYEVIDESEDVNWYAKMRFESLEDKRDDIIGLLLQDFIE